LAHRLDVLALIPAYNEAAHVGDVVRRASAFLPVWVVDDGSTDGTAREADAAGATVVQQPRNMGKGAALERGLREGADRGFRAVVTLDADGQHRPEELPLFLDAFDREKPDLVIGYRQFHKMPAQRRFANTLGTWLFSAALGERIRDNQSGYRLLGADFIRSLDFSTQGFEMEVEMITQAVRGRRRIAWVPIETIYGDEVSHFKPVRDSVAFLRTVWRARRAHR
jgi:glycosyltransferase involved in cell wall biosynthesis